MPSETDFHVALTPKGSDPTEPLVNNDEERSLGDYCKTRFTTLKPPMTKVENPFKLLAQLNRMQWLQFLVAFVAWSWDAFDFFTVSMTVSDLAETFDKTKTDITWGITLVLMLRSVGAILFGVASDRWRSKTRVRERLLIVTISSPLTPQPLERLPASLYYCTLDTELLTPYQNRPQTAREAAHVQTLPRQHPPTQGVTLS
jgi:hypothetical protein